MAETGTLDQLQALAKEMWDARKVYEEARAAFKLALKQSDPDTVNQFYGI